ncbi:pyruvate dehydrogenase (acetyl-transferring) E1 component subunit alpha [Haloarchaeobius amylolyticus]|uniref:pyruvate dehydrogenase (acetyl-transferring) E1 component subunit alpha n=1 Tax=Haloarchaeobius amylolyticus TaxID=1198296 RepID=UPI0022703363|nr:pyruvate dehydrogenase (acetyl-transferring) E1 component subunit alpha [Haloarchaeobius amylolyticus]
MSTQHEAESETQQHPIAQQSDDDELVQVLDAEGRVLPNAEVPDLSEEELLSMYRDIKLARRYDQRAISFQRQGRIATYAPMTGQEGSQVATSYALDEQDWLFPTYRDHAAKYVHGMELYSLLSPLQGHREGYSIPDDVNVLPEYIPIATQIPQAMGMAWGYQLQGETDRACLCHFGDGATSEGDFHEGLNFAGVFDAPAVFVCNNNQWAISVPREKQTASETIAQKADGYGIEGVRVDGMDPLAVYQVTREAILKAKNPGPDESRPTLIESVQYRYGAHTTADDPSVYRDGDEAERWRDWDPVDRLEGYLRREDILDDELAAEIDEDIEAEIQEAIQRATQTSSDPEDIVDHVYEEKTPQLEQQLEELNELREKYGDDALVEMGE